MRIDPHAHSDVSDGTDRPAALVAAAAVAGLDVVGITDHDTTAGWDEAAGAVAEHGVALLRGVELTARAEGRSVHVLGYLLDPEDPDLVALMDRARTRRVDRAREITERLAVDLPIAWEDVIDQVGPGATVGRPHIADALVARGVVATRSDAFATVLGTSSPYHVPHTAPPARDVVRVVREAGGVPVIAHPGATGRGESVSERLLQDLMAAGLRGIEVDHPEHDAATRARLRVFAARTRLLPTGSSDYHGTGKANRLGENVTPAEVYERIVAEGRLEVIT